MSTTRRKIAEVVGWYGALAIVTAFALASFDVIQADGLTFQLLNFTGALGILTISLEKHVHQSTFLNTFWAIIAAVALIHMLF